jgi:hypothetical protein
VRRRWLFHTTWGPPPTSLQCEKTIRCNDGRSEKLRPERPDLLLLRQRPERRHHFASEELERAPLSRRGHRPTNEGCGTCTGRQCLALVAEDVHQQADAVGCRSRARSKYAGRHASTPSRRPRAPTPSEAGAEPRGAKKSDPGTESKGEREDGPSCRAPGGTPARSNRSRRTRTFGETLFVCATPVLTERAIAPVCRKTPTWRRLSCSAMPRGP